MALQNFLLLSLLPTTILAQIQWGEQCPVITRTTTSLSCPKPTPGCITPKCIILNTIDVPCNCPSTISESTVFQSSCGCIAGCPTAYATNLICPTIKTSETPTAIETLTPTTLSTISIPGKTPITPPTPTTSTVARPTITPSVSSCPTLTFTEGPSCPTLSCVSPPSCTVTSEVVVPCSCPGIARTTSCQTTCGSGCKTSSIGLYLPCPISPLPPVETQ
ncbi:hypothetical protein HYALB_00005151 [Hymenoscyphus albidus]|uniref:Uncharacterized protein n=1 Tax=Hymenoscyphus albidus TaxID=595503 RepID=A0A9N9Q9E6_9HELO|nr:hypothetical protein HYALB_00005151 [Hymenoscyphus albidus]